MHATDGKMNLLILRQTGKCENMIFLYNHQPLVVSNSTVLPLPFVKCHCLKMAITKLNVVEYLNMSFQPLMKTVPFDRQGEKENIYQRELSRYVAEPHLRTPRTLPLSAHAQL